MDFAPVFLAVEHVPLRDEDGLGQFQLVVQLARVERCRARWRGHVDFQWEFRVLLPDTEGDVAARNERLVRRPQVVAHLPLGHLSDVLGMVAPAPAHEPDQHDAHRRGPEEHEDVEPVPHRPYNPTPVARVNIFRETLVTRRTFLAVYAALTLLPFTYAGAAPAPSSSDWPAFHRGGELRGAAPQALGGA